MSKNVALHICCSICLVAPREDLLSKGYKIHGIFFNPNIQPYTEYFNRSTALNSYIKTNSITTLSTAVFNSEEHLKAAKTEGIDRKGICLKCYEMRLRKTAASAKENSFESFTTTLLSSPFQDKTAIREIGASLEKEFKISFIDSRDWEKRHYASKKTIKDTGLYVQKYCGCIYSKADRKIKI